MNLILDVVFIFVLLGGYLLYRSRPFEFLMKNCELSYITLIYIAMAPYRGMMAKYTPFTDMLIDILLLMYFFYICFRSKIRICYIHLIWIVCFMSASALYAANKIGIENIIKIQEVKFHLGMALLIIILTTSINSRNGIQQIVNTFIVNSMIIALLDLITYMLYHQLMISSFLSNRNFISIYEYLGVLGSIYIYSQTKRKKLIVGIVVILADLLLMKSSSVFLGILATMLVFLIRKMHVVINDMYRLIMVLVIIAIFITIVVVATPKAFDNKYVSWVQNFRSSEDYTRTFIWEEALEIAKNNIVYGIGPDNFRDTRTNYQFPTHNDYLKVLTETGLFGMVGFILFVLGAIQYTLMIQDRIIKQYFFSAQLALLIFILFHGYINYVVFWLVFCIPYWIVQVERKETMLEVGLFSRGDK